MNITVLKLALLHLVLLISACATPYVHPPSSGHRAPALHTSHAIMDDGYQLPFTRWQAEGIEQAVVLAVHGMNDYRNAFASTGNFLSKQGITVVAYDQRGFGATQGQGYWHGSERLARDLTIMTGLLHEHHPGQPLYLMGESMGGAVILASLESGISNISGIILSAPAVWSREHMPYYQRAVLWIAAHTVPGKHLTGEGLDLKPSDNIEMLRALSRDPLVIKQTRVDVLYGVTNLMDDAALASSRLNTDTLILYGENDQIIPKYATCVWLERLPNDAGEPREILIYANGYHMLTRDLQADTVLADLKTWLLNHDRQYRDVKDKVGLEVATSFCGDSTDPLLASEQD